MPSRQAYENKRVTGAELLPRISMMGVFMASSESSYRRFMNKWDAKLANGTKAAYDWAEKLQADSQAKLDERKRIDEARTLDQKLEIARTKTQILFWCGLLLLIMPFALVILVGSCFVLYIIIASFFS